MNTLSEKVILVTVAQVVTFLASDAAKWINAQNIGINGGMA